MDVAIKWVHRLGVRLRNSRHCFVGDIPFSVVCSTIEEASELPDVWEEDEGWAYTPAGAGGTYHLRTRLWSDLVEKYPARKSIIQI